MPDSLRNLLLPRPDNGHKGTFGHALLIAGSHGMAGAGILAGKGCMRSGAGKLTIHIPKLNNDIMQVALPEAILHHDCDMQRWTSHITDNDLSCYNAIGIGPGIGTHEDTASALLYILRQIETHSIATGHTIPMVLDADALNILATHPQWTQHLAQNTIVTPHPLEYKRLTDAGADMKNTVLVLKGHPTTIFIPEREHYHCPYGNNGMGTAGSGDVLTGIILGLLAQGYPPAQASVLGVCLHAISGDLAAESLGTHSLIASDLTDFLPKAFLAIQRGTLKLQ